MSLSGFLKRLGAPRRGVQWSWGAQRPEDDTVFLQVWQDQMIMHEGDMCMLVDAHADDAIGSPGYPERVRHIASIRSGAACFMVMCYVKDPTAHPRKIAGFDEDQLFIGGDVLEKNGYTYIRSMGKKPAAEEEQQAVRLRPLSSATAKGGRG
jgi:hypothetical protein